MLVVRIPFVRYAQYQDAIEQGQVELASYVTFPASLRARVMLPGGELRDAQPSEEPQQAEMDLARCMYVNH